MRDERKRREEEKDSWHLQEIAPTSPLIASQETDHTWEYTFPTMWVATYFSIYCKLHARCRNTGGEEDDGGRKRRGDVAKRRHAAKLFVRSPPETRLRRARYIYAKERISRETGVNFKLDINMARESLSLRHLLLSLPFRRKLSVRAFPRRA